MARRTEEDKERGTPSRPKAQLYTAEKSRKPRDPLFHSGDPTLAERLEEEVYRPRR